jgi:hypothetical protein
MRRLQSDTVYPSWYTVHAVELCELEDRTRLQDVQILGGDKCAIIMDLDRANKADDSWLPPQLDYERFKEALKLSEQVGGDTPLINWLAYAFEHTHGVSEAVFKILKNRTQPSFEVV